LAASNTKNSSKSEKASRVPPDARHCVNCCHCVVKADPKGRGSYLNMAHNDMLKWRLRKDDKQVRVYCRMGHRLHAKTVRGITRSMIEYKKACLCPHYEHMDI